MYERLLEKNENIFEYFRINCHIAFKCALIKYPDIFSDTEDVERWIFLKDLLIFVNKFMAKRVEYRKSPKRKRLT